MSPTSEELFEKAIAEASKELERDRRRVHHLIPKSVEALILSLTKLASLRLQLDDYGRSDRLYREAEMHADDNPEVVAPETRVKLKSQRGYLCECKGDTEKAIECYELGLEISEDAGLMLSETRAVIHNNLAVLYKRAENWENSEHHYKTALVILEVLAGSNSEKVATIYHNLGAFYLGLGKHQTATRMFRRALRIRQRLYKDDMQPDVQVSLKNLGACYRLIGDEENAEACFAKMPKEDVITFLDSVQEPEKIESFADCA